MIAQIIFVVWRESIEALLVIGILQAWLRRNGSDAAHFYLWGGVAAGLAAAAGLSWVLTRFGDTLPPEGQDIFQMTLMLVAAALVVQMVLWMRRHGRTLKRQLESGLSEKLAQGRLWGIFALALIAVMREGAETVIFLQGIIAATGWTAGAVLAVLAAFAAALATYGLLQFGSKILFWRHFFRLTEVMLLLLACALFVNGTGYLVSLGVLPYTHPVLNLTAILDDSRPAGAVVAALTGYRATPDVVTVTSWLVYWGGIAFALRRQSRRATHA
ncbi:MAG: FTR1 family iron permease [Rhodobacteraceae bacterium]|nr:FTR1 family iron permease [Paracoccaceae bacterium]